MPETISQEEIDFIREVDRLAGEGTELQEIARLLGVAPATITYRLNRRGLTTAKTLRVVDRRSGLSLDDLIEGGELVISRSEEPVPA